MDEKTKQLIEWISKHAWRESRFLYPDPQEHVPMIPLLDEISRLFDVPKDDIGEILNKPEVMTPETCMRTCEQCKTLQKMDLGQTICVPCGMSGGGS
jgi:hypothetical protein